MGLREELLAIDPDKYAELRTQTEVECMQSSRTDWYAKALARVRQYPALAREVDEAITSAKAWDGGTLFGSQEFGATRESLIGAVTLIKYAELPAESV